MLGSVETIEGGLSIPKQMPNESVEIDRISALDPAADEVTILRHFE